ncbi:hypothetical protein BESB_036300 [Besnoitia besnoiti]|uniref:Uncharacterized protein n=1 Tax=Besnoitia besnoiti TaxID=94643 RepID=A0A2A9MNE1_BESBE|nr:hypothetical protein BESB_036300 [Besnoitia besnoiti]PFH37172.1 hypothetical protein BESB_036300 [Besnoitia besnoiti]
MKSVVAISLLGLTMALPMGALSEEMSSEMMDSVDMMEMEDVTLQETQDVLETSTAPLRYLEEDSTEDGLILIPETASPMRLLGKKNRAVYLAAPKYVTAPVVQKKNPVPVVRTKYSAPAPIKKTPPPTKKTPVVVSSKYTPSIVSTKYTPAAPSKKWRRLATLEEQPIEEDSASLMSESGVVEEERDLKKNSGYYVTYAPVVASPYCAIGSSCARYLAEEEVSDVPLLIEEEEAVYEQSVPERALGKKSRAVYVAPAPKKYVAPPTKKLATPVYRPAPVQKKVAAPVQKVAAPVLKKSAAPVVHKAPASAPSKYHPAVTTSKYTPVAAPSKKWRRLAEEDVMTEEESNVVEGESDEAERDLKKRETYYYPVPAYHVVAAPYCGGGAACY